MNWKKIQLDEHKKQFFYEDKPIFTNQRFKDALKFHSPGLAPVKDHSGWYHINTNGNSIYSKRYQRAFGYYENLATVETKEGSQIIETKGNPITTQLFDWCGNFQEGRCAVRNKEGKYYHVTKSGEAAYPIKYHYVGDYKYSYACVMNEQQQFTHIDLNGAYLHHKWFLDLGVYHKGFATAKDTNGWFHIDFKGNALYPYRFAQIEPFYNGWAFVETLNCEKAVVNEEGVVRKFLNH